MAEYTTIKVGELPSASLTGTDFIPHEVGGLLKKATVSEFASFIQANSAVGFRAVSVADGGTLPTTTIQEFILVGPGTYNNVGGGSPITVTEELNALVSNGTYWFIGVEIPIDPVAAGTASWGQITGILSAQTDLQNALNTKQNSLGFTPEPQITAGTTSQYWRGDKSWQTLNKDVVGLGNVDNTSDLLKPISNATQSALDLKVPTNRTLTINGTAFDLSANRSWTIPTHDAVTIGTANGLSLSGQVLSLGLASTSTNGALSATDWNIFNSKIGGSGTTNYLSKFTGASTLGNSLIYDNGTNVGIGTASPSEKLHVVGNGYFVPVIIPAVISGMGSPYYGTNITLGSDLGINQGAARMWGRYDGSVRAAITFETNTSSQSYGSDPKLLSYTETMRITGSGNVGIGTTSPSEKLDVAGNIKASGTVTASNGTLVAGTSVTNVWTGTQAAYDAIGTKSSTTIYFIQ